MILDGRKLKEKILDELKEKVSSLSEKPTLCVIQVGNDPASDVYIKQKGKMCSFIGYGFEHKKLDESISQEEILSIIDELNDDEDITSILVQMPIPNHLDPKEIQNRVYKEKDVDGLNDENIIDLINNKDSLKPCTAFGVIELLDRYDIPLEGKDVVIIGRSFLVGMPLFHLFENRNATVTLCHSRTKDLKDKTSRADILVVAVGKKHLVKEDMVKDGAVVIDVGINRENDKLYGDVDYDNIKDKASYITPVPGGVGPMTIASLAKNVLKSYEIQRQVKTLSKKY